MDRRLLRRGFAAGFGLEAGEVELASLLAHFPEHNLAATAKGLADDPFSGREDVRRARGGPEMREPMQLGLDEPSVAVAELLYHREVKAHLDRVVDDLREVAFEGLEQGVQAGRETVARRLLLPEGVERVETVPAGGRSRRASAVTTGNGWW